MRFRVVVARVRGRAGKQGGITKLSKRQIDMVCHKFGIGKDYELLTQTEIAEKYGVSNSLVSKTLSDLNLPESA